MDSISKRLEVYIKSHEFDGGTSECETVLDQLYQAYAESHESDPPEIGEGFKELEEFLCTLPLDDNNAVFNLCAASAPPMNIKLSLMVSNTVHTLFLNCINETMDHSLKRSCGPNFLRLLSFL